MEGGAGRESDSCSVSERCHGFISGGGEGGGGKAAARRHQLTVVWSASNEERRTPPTALESVFRHDEKKHVGAVVEDECGDAGAGDLF